MLICKNCGEYLTGHSDKCVPYCPRCNWKEEPMLQEGKRLIRPEDIKEQVPWEELEGVVILGIPKPGKPYQLWASTITVEEMGFLSAHFQAHTTIRLGEFEES